MEFAQGALDPLLEWWPYSERALWAASVVFAHHIVFYPYSLFVGIITHFNLFSKYKILQNKYAERSLVIKSILHLTIVSIIGGFPLVYYLVYPIADFFNSTNMHAPLPSFTRCVGELILCFILLDAHFYWLHRLFHTYPLLYKLFHKKHHEFSVNTGINAEYATVFEDVFLNYWSTLLYPIIVCSHPMVMCVSVSLRMVESLEVHSGYNFGIFGMFPLIHGGAAFHDFHHSQNRGNYGVFRVWDRICGTDANYNKKLQLQQTQGKAEEDTKAA